MDVRREVRSAVERNRAREASDAGFEEQEAAGIPDDFMEAISDMREYDVPYVTRCAIDLGFRVGAWFKSTMTRGQPTVERLPEFVEKAEPRVLAFDIECTKAPLKFPDAATDQVYMVSVMVDGQGYLFINREVVSEDVPDFEYTPKREFTGPFIVENLPTEKEMLERFFELCKEVRPQVYVTYNGDWFDWPFVEKRAAKWGIDMEAEIGVRESNGEYRARTAVHMDCLYWVRRDSYLPQGSHGLKAVTKYKLGYDPVEVDPEDMLKMAVARPRHMASYSVSDAVATYYLYMKYVHNFVFSLCTIIPLTADDVLRKGSGTLCEMLLQVEAHANNVIAPNKQVSKRGQVFEGHLLESETYIGGHVESLESGVFRADLPTDWKLDPAAFQELIDNVDRALKFSLEVEEGIDVCEVTNYRQVRRAIVKELELLRDRPTRREKPTIYHLDVAAMYPNIILSNRLQPSAVVSPETCAACEFNSADNAHQCKRVMEWTWRGEVFPATRAETDMIRRQLETETFKAPPGWRPDGPARFGASSSSSSAGGAGEPERWVPYAELPPDERDLQLHKRLKMYCQRQYKRAKDTHVEKRHATICQREHPFYIDTVRAFRDRRYEYKGLTKKWVKELAKAEKGGDKLAAEAARTRVVLFDSLQLAHKCILNSFYGYVMRKGSRWFSMEMGGVVTQTGASLITQARMLVERIGRPLELDTDGIWCILPSSFPEDFQFKLRSGKSVNVSYPCVMLNVDVHDRYTNHQYQTLVDPDTRKFATHSECSIYFEVDGPYRCMVLPASQEEGKLLKKRYAVFEFDGSLAELKGFELKRRGELKIIKIFQSQVFSRFLEGGSLEECYAHVAAVADYWLDVLDSHGEDMEDDELMELIGEARSMSKTLEEYGSQKSTAISTAKRLAEFLGAEMVKDKGLNCNLLISRKPEGAPVTERAIPRDIFSAELGVRKHFLRKWCKDAGMTDFDLRSVVDWSYYRQRLSNAIQKIVTIPAALQRVPNPVPRVRHPDWLLRVVRQKNDPRKQRKLGQYFGAPTDADGDAPAIPRAGSAAAAAAAAAGGGGGGGAGDIEDMLSVGGGAALGLHVARVKAIGSAAAAAAADAAGSGDESDGSAGPAYEEDAAAWLANRSRRYARRKRRRDADKAARGTRSDPKRGALAVAAAPRLRSGLSGGLAGYVDDMAEALAHGYLQVLEIRETGAPGEMVLWAMTSAKTVQRLNLRVPRRMLVNCVRPVPALASRRRQLTLPHGRRALNLYEVCRSEASFLRRDAALRRSQSDPLVEGVYESQTPLVMRALMDVGCVVAVRSDADDQRRRDALAGRAGTASSRIGRKQRQARIGAPARSTSKSGAGGSVADDDSAAADMLMLAPGGDDGRTFIPDHFDFLPVATHAYLEPTSASLRRAFVFHHKTEGRDGVRGVTLVAFVHETSTQEAMRHMEENGGVLPAGMEGLGVVGGVTTPVAVTAHVISVVPGAKTARGAAALASGAALPQVGQLFARLNALERCHPQNSLEVHNTGVGSMREMWQVASRAISDFVRRNPGPLVASAAASLPKQALLQLVPPLGNLPVVFRDLSPHEMAPLPALAWQNVAASRALSALTRWFRAWPQTLSIARYCQTPVGNLDEHLWSGATDLFFARLLRTNDHALWMSSTRLPDLGGAELRNETDALMELRPVPSFDWTSGFRSAAASHAQAKAAAGSRGGSARGGGVDAHIADMGSQASQAAQRDPRASPTVNRPGTYRRVCVELQLSHLALNTILHAAHIADAGGPPGPELEAVQDAVSEEAAADLAAGLVDHSDTGSAGARCRAAFHWLQVMVTSWHRDLMETQSPFADELLRNVYQWVASPASKLYDPALHRTLRALMVKVWQQLVTEVRRLGAVVVHASFSRLVLATPKQGGPAACAWTAYLLETIRSRPLFATLDLTPNWFSSGMLWLDAANYASLEVVHPAALLPAAKYEALTGGGGAAALVGADGRVDASLELLHGMGVITDDGVLVVADEPDDAIDSEDEGDAGDEHAEGEGDESVAAGLRGGVSDDEDDTVAADRPARTTGSSSSSSSGSGGGDGGSSSAGAGGGGRPRKAARPRRPPPLEDCVEYVSRWNIACFLPPSAESRFLELVEAFLVRPFRFAAKAAASGTEGSSSGAAATAAAQARIAEGARRCVTRFLSERLHTATAELRESGGDAKTFPDRPGKHLHQTSPALEFSKSVCFILSLDGSVSEEAGTLRKSVLRMLGVPDFSPEAVWRDPCLTYVLPDVVCESCKETRDLDVCRDQWTREPTEDEARAGVRGSTWFCPRCNTDYDRDEVEMALVDTLQQRSAAYQLQDLYCAKSRAIRTDRLSDVSESSAPWVNAEPPEKFHERVRVFSRIAEQHGMDWLLSEAEFLLGGGLGATSLP
ncbi:hypothetical protein FNF28_07844 [Cafeteria roenbergensis]|uniref:DNA polymerase epsilon catalytic subunit n=2 Tax=Cafeteria roenbergensis TaxID=33653 RepID=A0A5A8BYB4_CAFRO|nr:hypothetical protein FNF28_07844 [Cafeteria roenbergensis]